MSAVAVILVEGSSANHLREQALTVAAPFFGVDLSALQAEPFDAWPIVDAYRALTVWRASVRVRVKSGVGW